MVTNYIAEKYLSTKRGKEMRIFVVNGFQMTGILQSNDDVCLQIRETKSQKEKLIFFSGITTIEEV